MEGPPNTDRQQSTPSANATLGDVLYAKAPKAVAPERDWIELIQEVGGGDERALGVLYERTHRIVFTLILRMTNSREAAEELTVDVFHDVWRRSATYDPAGGTVVGWIMNQARSRAIDRLRFDNRKKRVNPHADGEEGDVSGPVDAVSRDERNTTVRTALDTLTTDERAAIETAFFGEMTYAETADRLKQPLGTIKTRIRSGLGKLRAALAGALDP